MINRAQFLLSFLLLAACGGVAQDPANCAGGDASVEPASEPVVELRCVGGTGEHLDTPTTRYVAAPDGTCPQCLWSPYGCTADPPWAPRPAPSSEESP